MPIPEKYRPISVKEGRQSFCRLVNSLIDHPEAEPYLIKKFEQPSVVMVSYPLFEQMKAIIGIVKDPDLLAALEKATKFVVSAPVAS